VPDKIPAAISSPFNEWTVRACLHSHFPAQGTSSCDLPSRNQPTAGEEQVIQISRKRGGMPSASFRGRSRRDGVRRGTRTSRLRCLPLATPSSRYE
jgi:hypothetical protein